MNTKQVSASTLIWESNTAKDLRYPSGAFWKILLLLFLSFSQHKQSNPWSMSKRSLILNQKDFRDLVWRGYFPQDCVNSLNVELFCLVLCMTWWVHCVASFHISHELLRNCLKLAEVCKICMGYTVRQIIHEWSCYLLPGWCKLPVKISAGTKDSTTFLPRILSGFLKI